MTPVVVVLNIVARNLQITNLTLPSHDTLEAQAFKINNPINYGVINENGTLSIYKKSDFFDRFAELSFNYIDQKSGLEVTEPVCPRWYRDPQKRVYEKLVFDPSPHVHPHYYNLFHGFIIEKTPPAQRIYHPHVVEEIKEFIKMRLCGGDEKFAEFFIWWERRTA